MTPRPEETAIAMATSTTLPRYGRKVLTTRPSVARSTGRPSSGSGRTE